MSAAPHSRGDARTAAILGTRSLVANATFDALLTLLIGAGAIQRDAARKMLLDLAADMSATRDDPEWRTSPAEIALQVDRLRRRAEALT